MKIKLNIILGLIAIISITLMVSACKIEDREV